MSNNNKSRVSSFSSNLGVDYIFKARKPMGKAFKMAIKMKIQPRETVVVGDQMLLMCLVAIVMVLYNYGSTC